MYLKREDIIIVLSAPSGAGKNTIEKKLLKRSKNLQKITTYTTRKPRGKEIDGKDYHFITKEKFEKMIKNNEFFEHAIIHKKYFFGSTKKQIEQVLSLKKDILFIIDVKGLSAIKKQKEYKNKIVSIFILPPSFEIMKQRLIKRGREGIDEINLRMQTAKQEIKEIKNYDYIVINDDLKTATKEIQNIIRAEKLKTPRTDIKNYLKNNKL